MNKEFMTKEKIRLLFMALFFIIGFIISHVGHKDWGSVCQIIGVLHFRFSMFRPDVLEKIKKFSLKCCKFFMYALLILGVANCLGEIVKTGEIVMTSRIATSAFFIAVLGLSEMALLRIIRMRALAKEKV